MERFKITAIDPRSGKPVEGFLDGDSADSVRLLAEQRGLKILAMESLGPAPAISNATVEPPASPAPSASDAWALVGMEGQGAKRKHRPTIPSLPEPAIPITPMLDMTFQLLFFFIMTFRPPVGEESEIPFSLPPLDEKQASAQAKEPPPLGDTPPRFEANLTLALLSNSDGDLRRVDIKGPGAVDSLVIPEEDLRNHAKVVELIRRELIPKLRLPFVAHFGEDKIAARGREGIQIKLQSSSNIKWEMVVQVIDGCRAAATQIADDPTKAVIALQSPVDKLGR